MRGWFESGTEQLCRDEYLEFLTDLRRSGLTLASSSGIIHDVVAFLADYPALRTRPRIYHLFKLSCLCLTDSAPDLPAVTFGSIDSSCNDCRLSSVILPVQSSIVNVPGSVSLYTSDSALDSFFTLSVDFGSTGLLDSYDPWTIVDNFNRVTFSKRPTASYKEFYESGTSLLCVLE